MLRCSFRSVRSHAPSRVRLRDSSRPRAHPRNDHQTRVRPTPPRGPPPAHRLYNPPASKPTRFAENSEAPEISPSLASPSCAARRRRKRGEEKAAAKQASHGRRRRVLRRLEEVDPPRGVPALPRHRRRRLHLRRPARPQHHRQPRSQGVEGEEGGRCAGELRRREALLAARLQEVHRREAPRDHARHQQLLLRPAQVLGPCCCWLVGLIAICHRFAGISIHMHVSTCSNI
uniref:Uncharacterized protein n=1 Tax=Oryza barthii TaxID=65489 RepID=A0A0D3GPJ0_9ORYZ